jgi:hypothetical protein
MTQYKQVRSKELFMGRLSFGADLLESLTNLCLEHQVFLGRIQALGAVSSARIGYYNQKERWYQFSLLDGPLEITQLVGNISLKDGKPFVHAHLSLADEKGLTYGGHLAEGTMVFACEFVLESFEGPRFERTDDPETGLALWSFPG